MDDVTSNQTEEQAKAGTCAHDRRAVQQLSLNVHVKHFDLACNHYDYLYTMCMCFDSKMGYN